MELTYYSSKKAFLTNFSFSLILVILLLALPACQQSSGDKEGSTKGQQEERADSFHISGKIEDPLNSELRLILEPFKRYRVFRTELDSSGRFSMEVPFERPSFFQLRQAKLVAPIFVEPGDSLRLTAKGKNPLETLSFSGDGKERNEYLFELKRLSIDTFGQAKKRLFEKDLVEAADASRFNRALDSAYRLQENLLEEHRDSLDQKFLELEGQRMALERALQRLRFRNYLDYNGKDSVELGNAFWGPIDELELSATQNIALPSYYSFLKDYGRKLRQEAIEADSGLTDSARFPVLYKAFKEKVEDDTARYAFLAINLYYQLTLRGAQRTGPYLEELEQAPLFEPLKDSLHAQYEKWERIAEGKEAPGFSYPTIEGDTLALADLEGELVYIDAWATWCGPCKKEIPYLKELEERFSEQPIAFVSISLDRERKKKAWAEMVIEKELEGHQLFANGEAFDSKLANDYLINSIPRFILIGPDGTIIDRNAERPSKGAEEQLKEALETEMEEGSA